VSVRKEDFVSQGKVHRVTLLTKDDQATTIECADDEYILDAAERVGIDLPATCRGAKASPLLCLPADDCVDSVERRRPPPALTCRGASLVRGWHAPARLDTSRPPRGS
jgi:2Fe-2S iron-sulfur cluster binding domain